MFVGKATAGFEFHDQLPFDKQIGLVLADDRAVFVAYGQGRLLLHHQADFLQSMGQGVLIDFLQVPVAMTWMS